MVDRRFRFGVSVSTTADRATWQENARRYEDEGFDVLLVADHLDGTLAPFSALVSAAGATDRLRVGTFVVNNDFWNPLVLAREAATADLLTGGRFELGIGAGHAAREYAAAGLAYDHPGVRVSRLAETLPLLRRLLDGETVTYEGRHVTLAEAATGLPPGPSPVPLLVGGNGDRLLAAGAEHASSIGFVGFTSGSGRHHTDLSHFTWAGLEDRIAQVRRAAGERFEALELNVLVQFVRIGDRHALAEEMATELERGPEAVLDSPFLMVGSTDDHVEHIERLQAAGVTYLVAFGERGAADLAPAIARFR